MSEAQTQYKPKFPQSYALLLEVYTGLMTAKPDEVSAWADRFKGLMKTFEYLKEDGVLPALFTRHFHEDVRDVARQVNALVKSKKLTEEQSTMTFGIANLAIMFGAS